MGFHGIQLVGIGTIGFGIAGAASGSGTLWAFIGLLITVMGTAIDPAVDDFLDRGRRALRQA